MPPPPDPRREHSLRARLLSLLAGTVALSLSVSLLGALLISWDLQRSQISRALTGTAHSAAIAVSAAAAFKDAKGAQEALGMLAALEEVRAAALYLPEGGRLATFGQVDLLPAPGLDLAEREPDITPLSDSTDLLLPVTLDQERLGWIYLYADIGAYRASFLRQSGLAVLASLVSLVLAVWLGLRFIDRLARPVQGLAGLAHRVRESQDFSLRADTPPGRRPSREIAELIFSFNALLAEVERREKAIDVYHSALEHMVDARTRQLAASNAALQAEVRVREASEAHIRASEEALRVQKTAADEANQAKSRFLAAASHDLRQPLHALGLLTSALNACLNGAGAPAPDPVRVRRLAGLIGASVQDMSDLLKDLLDLSRLEAGTVVPKPACVRLADVFGLLEARFLPPALNKGLRLRFLTCRHAVWTDALLLDRILANLIANAVRYTDRGGVLVGLRRRGRDRLRIEVIDTGPGIPEAMHARIFEAYVQLDNPERDRDKGQGLGLSIVRHLADLLGIPVRVASRQGRGSRFSVELPLCDPIDPAPEPAPVSYPLAQPAPGRLVVLVEDDVAIQSAMRAVLEPWGLELLAASDLESAEAALAARGCRPDLVLSDYRLPGELDGIAVIARLRARYGDDLPALLVTGETGEETLQAVAASGLRVMHKPLQPAKLRALMTHLMR